MKLYLCMHGAGANVNAFFNLSSWDKQQASGSRIVGKLKIKMQQEVVVYAKPSPCVVHFNCELFFQLENVFPSIMENATVTSTMFHRHALDRIMERRKWNSSSRISCPKASFLHYLHRFNCKRFRPNSFRTR